MNTNRIRIALAALVVSLGLLAGCGGGSGSDNAISSSSSSSSSTDFHPPATFPPPEFTVATAKVPTLDVFAGRTDAEPVQQLHYLPDYPLVLLVLDDGGDRVHVSLPTRPNGSTGWVRQSDVTLSANPYRVVIDLSDHQLTAYEGGEVRVEALVGVGTAETPTPTGHFFITELVQPPDPDGAYGPYVFALSAHSDVLDQFGGGDGQVGIHGTNQPELLGTDVSHGCIRMSNPDILRLTELLPLGTPVDIQA